MSFIVVCIALLVVLIVFAFVVAVYFALDSWFVPHMRTEGRVIGKLYTPPSTSVVLVYGAATKTRLPQTVTIGELVDVDYVVGRLCGEIYIKQIILDGTMAMGTLWHL